VVAAVNLLYFILFFWQRFYSILEQEAKSWERKRSVDATCEQDTSVARSYF
jgi:hypothetical protein